MHGTPRRGKLGKTRGSAVAKAHRSAPHMNSEVETRPGTTPVPAVLAVVVRDGRVLLVRRANNPDKGLWGYPGGRIEPGETWAQAAIRELRDAAGVRAQAVGVLRVLDVIDRADDGALRHHFVLIAVGCRWQAGEGQAADDALEARWFTLDEVCALGPTASAQVEALARLAI